MNSKQKNTKSELTKFTAFSHQPIARKINYLNELPHRAGKYAYTVFTVSSLSQGHVLAISSKFKSYCEINISEKKKQINKESKREIYST